MKLRGEPCTDSSGCKKPIYCRELCVRHYRTLLRREAGVQPRPPATEDSRFMTVAEAFRVYWNEAESEEEFNRASQRARQALWRYAVRLFQFHKRKYVQP